MQEMRNFYTKKERFYPLFVGVYGFEPQTLCL